MTQIAHLEAKSEADEKQAAGWEQRERLTRCTAQPGCAHRSAAAAEPEPAWNLLPKPAHRYLRADPAK